MILHNVEKGEVEMASYKIAGLIVTANWENRGRRHLYYRSHDCAVMPRALRAYQMYEEEPEHSDLELLVKAKEPFVMPEHYKKIGNEICYKDGEDFVLGFFTDYENELPGCSLKIKSDYSYAELIPHRAECENFDLQRAQFAFEGRMLYMGGFVLHGAAIEWNGKGMIFTGLSGAGKSTQAHLWKQYRNAWVINGDCPAIRQRDGITYMYGTPWCGTSGESIDRETPLHAVIMVKQAAENKVRKLEGQEKFMTVLSQIFRSNVDEKALDLAIANLDKMIDTFQVYELQCRKEEGAVRELEKVIVCN